MNHERINKRLSTAIEIIALAEEEMKSEIDWDDAEAVDLAYGLQDAGGRLLKIKHEINKKYKEDQP